MPFEIVRNDIVKMQVDAIVNTANPQPIVGDGVDRAVHMAAGARLYFAASHATGINKGPVFTYRFENATVTFDEGAGAQIVAKFADGSEKIYGDPKKANDFKKLWDCVEAARTGTRPVCTAKTALPHAMCIEKLFREVAIGDFPADAVKDNPEMDRVEVPGLLERLYDAYEKEILLPEL